MTQSLPTGLYLTVAGMGLVFLSLAVLWGLITLLLKMDRPLPDAPDPASDAPLAADGIAPDVLAAITAGVMTFRAERPASGIYLNPNQPADSWLSAGRERQLSTWQPRRNR